MNDENHSGGESQVAQTTPQKNNPSRTPTMLRRILLGVGAILMVLLIVGVGWLTCYRPPPWTINSLASDEQLIAWFQANRPDIEDLVLRYRTYIPPEGKGHNEWEKLGDTPAIRQRSGVRYVIPILDLWLPEPYSVEARKRDGNRVVDWREKARYQTLKIIPADAKRFHHNTVWKDMVYFPVEPHIENGFIIGPVDALGRNGHYRISPHFNSEPPLVDRDECAFRRIDAQWFVRMCRTIN